MKTLLISLFTILLMPLIGLAQTSHSFSLQGSALGYSSGGASMIAADAGATIELTPSVSALQDNIILSTQVNNANIAVFSLGGVQYKLPFKKGNFQPFVFGEAGEVTNAMATTAAYSAGGGLDYYPTATPSLSITIFKLFYLRGNVPIGNGKVTQNGLAYGVSLNFGK
jgi:hypothetical protein